MTQKCAEPKSAKAAGDFLFGLGYAHDALANVVGYWELLLVK